MSTQEDSSTKKVSIALVGASGKMGRALTHLIEEDIGSELGETADVVIDFSSKEGTKKAIEMGLPLVCGTTGLGDEEFAALETLSKTVPVLYAPNFSLGMAICFDMMKRYGPLLTKFSECFIEETHHTEKKDSPSGTALKLGELLGCKEIESRRKKDVVGIHALNFSFGDETLLIRHEAFSRDCFARGALFAAKKIFTLPPKLYSLTEILLLDSP